MRITEVGKMSVDVCVYSTCVFVCMYVCSEILLQNGKCDYDDDYKKHMAFIRLIAAGISSTYILWQSEIHG